MTRLGLVAVWLCGGVLVGCGGGGGGSTDAMVDAGKVGDGAVVDAAQADAAPVDAAMVDAAMADATLPVDAAPIGMGLDATTGPVTFGARTDIGTSANSHKVFMADFNGDAKLDLAVAHGAGVIILVNTTATGATTATFTALAQTTCDRPNGLAVADFNADGRPDVAVACVGDSMIGVLLNTTASPAATSFAAHVDFATAASPYELRSADYNGDGKPDLAVIANSVAVVAVLLNTTAASATTPSFAAHVDFGVGNVGLTGLATADIDRDGKPDLLVLGGGPTSQAISVLINQTAAQAATPAFAARVNQLVNHGVRAYFTMGDLNGDSTPDLVSPIYSPNSLGVFLNTTAVSAAPSFAAEAQVLSGVGFNPTMADLDMDGRLDVVVAGQPGNGGPGPGGISLFFNRTPTSATTPTLLGPFNLATVSEAQHAAVGDLNGDGKPDLAVAGLGGFVTIYLAQ